MELLVAVGIGYLGHRLASKGRDDRTRPAGDRHSDRHSDSGSDSGSSSDRHRTRSTRTRAPMMADTSVAALLAGDGARMTARWEEALDPARTGVITPNNAPINMQGNVPFFRSARSQNTSESVKQTRMELFTGVNDADFSQTGTYRHKREVEAQFQPSESAARVTFSGSAGNPASDLDRAMSVERANLNSSGARYNNVTPVQQLRVGRGVNVGPGVAATGGFHSRFRILPTQDELGSYKRHQLPGNVVPGKSRVNVREAQSRSVLNHDGKIEWTQERRPTLPSGQRALTAAAAIDEHVSTTRRAQSALEVEYYGNGSREGPSTGVNDSDATRLKDRSARFPSLNTTSAASGPAVGHFAVAEYDLARTDKLMREQGTPYTPNASGTVNAKGRTVPAGEVLQNTQRNLTNAFGPGNGASRVSRGEAMAPDRPSTTLREMMTNTETKVLGGSSLVDKTDMDNENRFKVLDRTAKRSSQLVEAFGAPGRMNVFDTAGDGAKVVKKTQTLREGLKGHEGRMPQYYDKGTGAETTPLNKLPPHNPRLDLSTARDQLRSNPYAHNFS